MNKFIIGRYMPGNSIVHRLDARVKLATGFYFIGVLMLVNHYQAYFILALYSLILVRLTGISLRFFLKGIKPLLQIIIFTVVLQLLFSRGGVVYFEFGPFVITRNGLLNGASVFFRFTLTTIMSTVISLTTRPIDLTDGIEFLLTPLKLLKISVQDIAIMLSIALRFIPTLIDEAARIMKAQQSRGVEFGEGNIFQQMRLLIPVFLPLFIGSFYRAEELANALDVRGYQGNKKRTKYRMQKWHSRDTLYLLSYLLLTNIVIYFHYWFSQ